MWYFWPAKGVPDDYDSVIDFLSEMRSYMKVSQTAKEYDEEGKFPVIYLFIDSPRFVYCSIYNTKKYSPFPVFTLTRKIV